MYRVTLTEEVTVLRTVILETEINPLGKELLLRKLLEPTKIDIIEVKELYEPIIVEIIDTRLTNWSSDPSFIEHAE